MRLFNNMQYLEKFPVKNVHYSYSINFEGDHIDYDIPNDVEKVLWYYTEDDPCEYCNCGNTMHVIVSMNNGNYALLESWSGCLTYEPDEMDSKITFANSFDDLYDFCLTDNLRERYDKQKIMEPQNIE